MATKPTLHNIGNDPITGVEITKEPLNQNYTMLNNYTQAVNNEINAHIASLIAHSSTGITNASTVGGAKVTNALNTLLTAINVHIANLTAHNSTSITNSSTVTGTKVTDALNQLKSQINAVVVGGTEVDPRLSQALVDADGKTWGNFKALQDYWQAAMPRIIDGATKYNYKIAVVDGKPYLQTEEVT